MEKSALLDGGPWWAEVEVTDDSDAGTRETRYAEMIAWERTSDGTELVAWINARRPVRSDRWDEEACRITGGELRRFSTEPPDPGSMLWLD